MTFRIPKALLLALLVALAAAAGVAAALLVAGEDSPARAGTAAPAPTAVTIARTVMAPSARPKPKRLVRLSVRTLPKQLTDETITIRGRTTRGATVTVRGKRAVVRRGVYHVKLRIRLGTNRFTVVARRAGRKTRRRPMKLVRVQPAPPPVAATAQREVGCGGDPYAYMAANGTCIGPAHPPTSGPASPEGCPSGWVPVGVTGACAPGPTVTDTNGPSDPCPPGTNWVEPDGCVDGSY